MSTRSKHQPLSRNLKPLININSIVNFIVSQVQRRVSYVYHTLLHVYAISTAGSPRSTNGPGCVVSEIDGPLPALLIAEQMTRTCRCIAIIVLPFHGPICHLLLRIVLSAERSSRIRASDAEKMLLESESKTRDPFRETWMDLNGASKD